jgi:hypothetical protein
VAKEEAEADKAEVDKAEAEAWLLKEAMATAKVVQEEAVEEVAWVNSNSKCKWKPTKTSTRL